MKKLLWHKFNRQNNENSAINSDLLESFREGFFVANNSKRGANDRSQKPDKSF